MAQTGIELEVDIELNGKVIHTDTITVNMGDSLFLSNWIDGMFIRGEVDKQVTSKIKTNWRYAEAYQESDKEFASLLERSGVIKAKPKHRQPRDKGECEQ